MKEKKKNSEKKPSSHGKGTVGEMNDTKSNKKKTPQKK